MSVEAAAPIQVPVRHSLALAALYAVLLLVLFHQTVSSMVSIWVRSETFAHGFLILPISLWLAWRDRDLLAGQPTNTAPWLVLLIIPPGLAWLFAVLVDVQVVQQLALVAMLVAGVWAIVGHALFRILAFPLLYLFFAVPVGEALVAPMMEFTATSTVWLIRLTGIPVYREGLYFMLPSGNWSIVEACSGVRYIIASVTLGVLYAFLTYKSLWRRAIFVLASMIAPVLANTLRAYIIVMLGHLSDMTIATGVDHLIYGWVFFGLIMFLLFWIGSFFREDHPDHAHDNRHSGDLRHSGEGRNPASVIQAKNLTPILVTLAALITATIWPLTQNTLESNHTGPDFSNIEPPAPVSPWTQIDRDPTTWHPDSTVPLSISQSYQLNGKIVTLHLHFPSGPDDPGEVVGSADRFTTDDTVWRIIDTATPQATLAGNPLAPIEASIQGSPGTFLAWSWYQIGPCPTANEYLAKLFELRARLGLAPRGSYRAVLATVIDDTPQTARATLQAFLDSYGAALTALYDTNRGSAD